MMTPPSLPCRRGRWNAGALSRRGCPTIAPGAAAALWLAESEEEMTVADEKQRRMAGHQVHSERQTPQQIAGREPLLRGGLAGGLWVPGDGIVYAPNVARWLIADAGDHLTCLRDSVQTIDEPQVLLASGQRLQARAIVVACGLEANALLAENWLRPKKANWRLPIATGRGCSTSWLSWVTAPAPTAAAPRWRLTFSRGPPASC